MNVVSRKVLREVRGALPVQLDADLLEGLDVEEVAQLTQAKEALQSYVRRFLGLEPGTLCSLPKVYRTATYRWLQGLGRALWACTGKGWEQFATTGTMLDLLKPEGQEVVRLCLGWGLGGLPLCGPTR